LRKELTTMTVLIWETPPTRGNSYPHAHRAVVEDREYWIRERVDASYRLLEFHGDSLIGAVDHPSPEAAMAAAEQAERTAAGL
jgi:hypothetical protein